MTENPHKWRDVAWKKAIIDGAWDAIAYFMPDLASDMDTSKEVIGITGMELPVKDSDSDKDMRISDIFLHVPVKGGRPFRHRAESHDCRQLALTSLLFGRL
jgi:hypothetical protein